MLDKIKILEENLNRVQGINDQWQRKCEKLEREVNRLSSVLEDAYSTIRGMDD